MLIGLEPEKVRGLAQAGLGVVTLRLGVSARKLAFVDGVVVGGLEGRRMGGLVPGREIGSWWELEMGTEGYLCKGSEGVEGTIGTVVLP